MSTKVEEIKLGPGSREKLKKNPSLVLKADPDKDDSSWDWTSKAKGSINKTRVGSVEIPASGVGKPMVEGKEKQSLGAAYTQGAKKRESKTGPAFFAHDRREATAPPPIPKAGEEPKGSRFSMQEMKTKQDPGPSRARLIVPAEPGRQLAKPFGQTSAAQAMKTVTMKEANEAKEMASMGKTSVKKAKGPVSKDIGYGGEKEAEELAKPVKRQLPNLFEKQRPAERKHEAGKRTDQAKDAVARLSTFTEKSRRKGTDMNKAFDELISKAKDCFPGNPANEQGSVSTTPHGGKGPATQTDPGMDEENFGGKGPAAKGKPSMTEQNFGGKGASQGSVSDTPHGGKGPGKTGTPPENSPAKPGLQKAITSMMIPRLPKAAFERANMDTHRSGSAVMTRGNSLFNVDPTPLMPDAIGNVRPQVIGDVYKGNATTCKACGRTHMSKSCPSCDMNKAFNCDNCGMQLIKSHDGRKRCPACG